MIKDITAKSNNRQDLGNKIRYSKIFYADALVTPKVVEMQSKLKHCNMQQ